MLSCALAGAAGEGEGEGGAEEEAGGGKGGHRGRKHMTMQLPVLIKFLYVFIRNSTVEGAMKLKFASFCSSWDALSYGILFGRNQNFQILAENHGL